MNSALQFDEFVRVCRMNGIDSKIGELLHLYYFYRISHCPKVH